ncbi:hypothetical protein MJ575_11665 [Klebsiella pneumoniae]|nr:hypothetical protein MJ575_11665 [Klebsiella pneumoniae]
MRDGKIEQDGTPREIYEEPKNLFVASFIGEIIFDATVIERLDETSACALMLKDGMQHHLAGRPASVCSVLLRPGRSARRRDPP